MGCYLDKKLFFQTGSACLRLKNNNKIVQSHPVNMFGLSVLLVTFALIIPIAVEENCCNELQAVLGVKFGSLMRQEQAAVARSFH